MGRRVIYISSSGSWGQSFTAQRTGGLDQVDLYLSRDSATVGPLTVDIRNVTAGGTPDTSTPALGTATVPAASVGDTTEGFVAVPFATPVLVTAGTKHAIVVNDGGTDLYFWFTGPGDNDYYALGSFLYSFDPPAWGVHPVLDMVFRTYVTTPPADTTPPTVTCSASPSNLKSNNHKLASITTTVTVVHEAGGSAPAGFRLASVGSSQADSGLAGDDVPNDRQGWTIGGPDTSGLVRIERYARDRVYTLTYQASDVAGNYTNCSTTVTVKK